MCTKILYPLIWGLSATLLASAQVYKTTAQGTEVDPTEILSVLPEDAIRSIDHPRFLRLPEADKQMREDEPVIGLKLDGEAKAYPLYALSAHEIVNDTVAGTAVAITW